MSGPEYGHPEKSLAVLAANLTHGADTCAHRNGTHPRSLPGVEHYDLAPGDAALNRAARHPRRGWRGMWARVRRAPRNALIDAAIALLRRHGPGQHEIVTRNVLVSYKGGLQYLHSLHLWTAIAVFIAMYFRERAADAAELARGGAA